MAEQTQKIYSQDMDPATEAQALLDSFNGNLPTGGGEMALLFPFFDGRPHIHQNDWKHIYELALKLHRDAKRSQ